MKNTFSIIICCFTILLVISPIAYSGEGGLYGSGTLGLAMLRDSELTLSDGTANIESDSGLALAGAIGYYFGNNLRMEGEIAYQGNDFDNVAGFDLSGDTSSLAFLLNGYYDFTNWTNFSTYISIGIGAMKVEVNDLSIVGLDLDSPFSGDDTVLAYQISYGVGYAISENLILDLKYRYLGASDPKFETFAAEFSSSNLSIGMRFSF